MADAQNKLKLQQAHATNALSYGNIGTATYVEQSSDWAYLRSRGGRLLDHPSYTTAAFPFECISSEGDPSQTRSGAEPVVNTAHHDFKSGHNTFRYMPEVLLSIPHHQRRNTTTQSDSVIDNALHPGQLAFGGAVAISSDRDSNQTVPIAAVVSGSNFESVRLLLIGNESFETTDVRGVSCIYRIPTIADEEDGLWTGMGDPIQQVCFAATCGSETTQSAWMAARSRTATTIFHPLFHISQMISEESASRLNPNPVLVIPISRTGGYPHADVAFHPRDHKLLALVDIRGNWSVWKVETPGRSSARPLLFKINLKLHGRLSTDMKLLRLQGDWHRVRWISRTPHESDCLLVCSRSQAALFDSVGHNLGAVDLRRGSDKDQQLILDVVNSTTNPAHCYILTSTRLLLMSAADIDWADSSGQQLMVLLLSWSHFRDMADHSLSLILVETAQATTILVTSVHNNIITACRVGQLLEQPPTPISLADPIHFQLHGEAGVHDCQSPTRILAFRNLQVQTEAGLSARKTVPVLFKGFLGEPLGLIKELLYQCSDERASSTIGQPRSSTTPLPGVRPRQKKTAKHTNLEDLTEFVVVDEVNPWAYSKIPVQGLFSDFVEGKSIDSTILDWQDVYKILVESLDLANNEITPVEVAEAIEGLNLQLERQDESLVNVQTLGQILDIRTKLNDFGGAEQAFTNVLADSSRDQIRQFRITHLRKPDGQIHDVNVSELHDGLKANWIQTLPPWIDKKVRLLKDRLTRSVTAELALASITIGPAPENDARLDVSQAQQNPSQDSGLVSYPASLANTSTTVREAAAEDPACLRLRRYGPLTKPVTPLFTSRSLMDMLAHLPTDINTNPVSYNWRVTEARLAAERADEGAREIDPKAWRKAERLAAVLRRKLEAQKQMSQAMEQDLAPPMIVSSQLEPVARDEEEVGISLPLPQPVGGRFGSKATPDNRVAVTKKKSRKAGF